MTTFSIDQYRAFIHQKSRKSKPAGIAPLDPMPSLKPFQWALTKRALKLGRSAIFADCGLGKTLMQLEWARQVKGRCIIFAPLAVGMQTEREADRFGYEAAFCHDEPAADVKIIVANYESQHKFDPDEFNAVVLDESSILKNFDGRTRGLMCDRWALKYRLCCTATPAPNDYIELGSHSEFLGRMSYNEMQSMFFVNDGNQTQKYRLKGHAVGRFWDWVSEWASFAGCPDDIGFDEDGYTLPALNIHEQIAETSGAQDGYLFKLPVSTLSERLKARSETIAERVALLERLCHNGEQWIVWCALNNEAESAASTIDGAVNLTGLDSMEEKERKLMAFIDGQIRVLVTKPKIAGFGMNFQHCHNMAFLGLNDSYETVYQPIRRCWRFGQARPVEVHMITSDLEHAVSRNIKRKTDAAAALATELGKRTKKQLCKQ